MGVAQYRLGVCGKLVAGSESSVESAIQGRRFLVIDMNDANLEKIERYLLMDAAAKVYKAKAPLTALRILQDRRTPVDCVICAQKTTPITGLDFLQNIRTGRYGGKSLRETSFILTMPQKDDAIVNAADSFLVSGYMFGELNRDLVSEVVNKVLKHTPTTDQPNQCRIAHVRESGLDLVLVPFESGFGNLSLEEQQETVSAIRKTIILAGLKGEVIPVWPSDDDGTSFLAPENHHAVVKNISMDFVRANLNRQFTPVGLPDTARSALPAEANKSSTQAKVGKGALSKPTSSKLSSKSVGIGQGDTKRDLENQGTPFSDEHIRKVMAAFKQLGPEKFIKAFVRGQPIIHSLGEKKFDTLMTEFYVSVDRLRKPLFANAQMRGRGLVFHDLTLLFDQIILRSFEHVPVNGGLFSINLNVQSVFTKAFENFIETAPADRLVVEFRQPNIIEYFDEYEMARGIILAKGAKIAVDQILPDTLGLVHLEYLGASIAKFQWSKDSDDTLKERSKALSYMTEHGIEAIMTRVDESRAMDMGAELGVHRFQGFLIDDMVQEQTKH